MNDYTNITLFGENVGYQCGGAEKSTFELLRNLKKAELRVVYYKDDEMERQLKLLPYANIESVQMFKSRRFPYVQYFLNWLQRKDISEKMKDADLLLAQGIPASIAINAFSGKSVYFIMDESALNKPCCYETSLWRQIKFWVRFMMQLPFYALFCVENRKALKTARLVVANSNYMAHELNRLFQLKVEPIYPSIAFRKFKQAKLPAYSQRDYIVLIGDNGCKGIHIFEKIAAFFPEEKFMVVGKKYTHGKKGNITYQGYADDPLEIYRKAKIVLMPSLWEEAFGMVAVEAGLLGIPVLVSNRGGLPETVPGAYVVNDYRNVHDWVQQLRQVLANPDQYIEEAREHVAKYDDQIQFQNWIQRIENTTGIKITK